MLWCRSMPVPWPWSSAITSAPASDQLVLEECAEHTLATYVGRGAHTILPLTITQVERRDVDLRPVGKRPR